MDLLSEKQGFFNCLLPVMSGVRYRAAPELMNLFEPRRGAETSRQQIVSNSMLTKC